MAKNDSFLQEFKRAMIKKHVPKMAPVNGANPGFSRGRATGIGADQQLQESEAAGVVHEGEFVVDAPAVRMAGGPEALNAMVEKQATGQDPELPAFARGGQNPSGYQHGGYHAPAGDVPQVGSNPVSSVSNDLITPKPTPVTSQTSTTPPGPPSPVDIPPVQSNLATPPVEPVKIPEIPNQASLPAPVQPITTETTAEPFTRQGQSQKADRFETLEDEQITALQDIAAGEGKASGVIGTIARDRLAGQLAAGNMSSAQVAAQSGLTGGALQGFRAKQRRDTALAQTGLEGQLAIDAVNRAENATLQLAGIASKGKAFEEAKRQFGEDLDLRKDMFGLEKEKFEEFKHQFSEELGISKEKLELAWDTLSENIRQFDESTALTLFLDDRSVQQGLAKDFLLADNPEAAASIYKDKFGIDVDLSRVTSKLDEETFGNSMANLALDIPLDDGIDVFDDNNNFTEEGYNTKSFDNLMGGWNSFNPDNQVTKENAADNAEFQTWANNSYVNTAARRSAIFPMLDGYTDEDKENLIFGMEHEDGGSLYEKVDGKYFKRDADGTLTDEEFEYHGATGIEGVKLALTTLINTNGISTNADGATVHDFSKEAWKVFDRYEDPKDDITPTGDSFSQLTDPKKRDEFILGNLVGPGVETTEGQISIGDLKPSDLARITANPDSALSKQLTDLGFVDSVSGYKDINAIPDISKGKNAKQVAVELGLQTYGTATISDEVEKALNDSVTGSRLGVDVKIKGDIESVSFINPETNKGQTVLIGDQFYEIAYQTNFKTGVTGFDHHRKGQLWAYEIDSDGNRTGELKIIKEDEDDL